MSVRLISLAHVPRLVKKRKSPIKQTPEWKDVCKRIPDLQNGQALAVDFSPQTLALGKVTAERFRRLLAQEIRAQGWKGVRLFFRARVLYCSKER
jgi:hypothetical protein